MFDNIINIIFDRNIVFVALGFIMSIMSCFMLKKGIEHAILGLERKPFTQGLLLTIVASLLFALSLIMLKNSTITTCEQVTQETTVAKK